MTLNDSNICEGDTHRAEDMQPHTTDEGQVEGVEGGGRGGDGQDGTSAVTPTKHTQLIKIITQVCSTDRIIKNLIKQSTECLKRFHNTKNKPDKQTPTEE